jgi:Protein of unknown function (DUF3833)
MKRLLAAAFAVAITFTAPAVARETDPMRFFEGRTESIGTVKIVTKKLFRSRAIGKGEILPDGSLRLIQRVEDEGELVRERRWHMRKVGPGRYTGRMSEARGPVVVEEVDGKYRFRFRMDGNVSVEQWLIPAADGLSAKTKVIIRKFGVRVGGSNGIIRKLD